MKSNQLNPSTLMKVCLLLFKGEFPLAVSYLLGKRFQEIV